MPVQLIRKIRDRQPITAVKINPIFSKARIIYTAYAPPGIILSDIVYAAAVGYIPACFGNATNGVRLHAATAGGIPKLTKVKNSYSLVFDSADKALLTDVVFGKANGASPDETILAEVEFSSVSGTQIIAGYFSSGYNVTAYGRGLVLDGGTIKAVGVSDSNGQIIDSGITAIVGKKYTIAARFSAGGGLFINGKKVGSGNISHAWGYRFCVGATGNLIDQVSTLTKNFNGTLSFLYYEAQAKSDADLLSLTANPWQIFEPETIPLFYSAGGGATDLSIFDALHSHAGDNLAFSLSTYLAAQDSTHAHAVDNLTLNTTSTINLVLSDALHGLSSDVIAFITGSYLAVADSIHGHSSDVVTLATSAFLAVAEALHAHAADNVTLDTSNATPLTLQDALHTHSADNNVLTLDTWLAIVEAVHAHSSDNVSISSEELLAIADALHSLASDALVLTLPSPPGTCPTVDEIKVAVWQHIIESGVSAEAMLRIVSAVLAGKVNGANTGVETFVGIDGVTNRVVSTVDSVGNRTSVSVDGY